MLRRYKGGRCSYNSVKIRFEGEIAEGADSGKKKIERKSFEGKKEGINSEHGVISKLTGEKKAYRRKKEKKRTPGQACRGKDLKGSF